MSGAPRLNGFDVPRPLLELMLRADWPGKRMSKAWLCRFGDPASGFVEFCALGQLERENANLRDPALAVLRGSPSAGTPPGDFDPEYGFLIGFTDHVDAAICVDFRSKEPRIIYDSPSRPRSLFATAFDSLDEFCAFYKQQHGG
ncbi:MAG: hypothetical protein HC850_16540 [Rhodomicrobium sp.]|nr:hypothetical protein [Rhodomicrobium sp.]